MALEPKTYTDAADRITQMNWIKTNGYTKREETTNGDGSGTLYYETSDSRTVIEKPENAIRIVATAGDFTAKLKHELIAVTDTSAPRALTLGPKTKFNGWCCKFKDESGNAGTNNITITPSNGGKTINGAPNYVINTDYGEVEIYYRENYFTC